MPEPMAMDELLLAAEQSLQAPIVLVADGDGVVRACCGAPPGGNGASSGHGPDFAGCIGKHWRELFDGCREMPIPVPPNARQLLFVRDDDKRAYRVVVREAVGLDGGQAGTIVLVDDHSPAQASALDELENGLRLGRTAAEFAHELNNVLTTVLGWLQILEQELPAEHRSREPLRMISGEAKRAARATASLLSIATSRSVFRHEPVDLNALVGGVLALVAPRLAQSGIRLEHDLGPVPAAHGCEDQLKQVFINILLNAAKAIGTDGTIRVTTDSPGPGRVRVRVSDTGCGIAADRLDRIFDAFCTTHADSGGTGLGLHVSRDIIRRHNGDICVESVSGKGSTFTVLLPASGPA